MALEPPRLDDSSDYGCPASSLHRSSSHGSSPVHGQARGDASQKERRSGTQYERPPPAVSSGLMELPGSLRDVEVAMTLSAMQATSAASISNKAGDHFGPPVSVLEPGALAELVEQQAVYQ